MPDDGNDEKTPKRWRKFLPGNFLGNYLRDRDKTKVKNQQPEEDDKEEFYPEKTKRFRLLDKLQKQFSRGFRRFIGLDIVPVVASGSNLNVDTPELNSSINLFPNNDLLTVSELNNAPKHQEEGIDDGVLPISKEAIKRYQELHSISQTEADSSLPNILSYETLTEPPERTGGAEAPMQKAEVASTTYEQRNSNTKNGAVSVDEILQRRIRRRLRRDKRAIRQLNKQAISTKQEQADIKRQQEDFGRKLSDREKLNQEVLNQQTTAEQLSNLVYQSNQVEINSIEKLPPIYIAHEVNLSEKTISSDLPPQEIKELISHPDSSKPEVIEHAVEKAADQNLAIENLYERRHEKKDEPAVIARSSTANQSPVPAAASFTTNGYQTYNHIQKAVTNTLPQAAKQKVQTLMNEDLYRQAAKSGFWTAIAICILAFLAIIALR